MKKYKVSPGKLYVKQLVESFKGGNQHAFEQLTECFDDVIDRYLLNRGVICREDREDLRQSIYVAIAQQIISGKYHEEDHFEKWLNTMIYNFSVNYFRYKRAHQLDAQQYELETRVPDAGLPHDVTAEQLLCGIHLLSPKEQTVIHKRHFEKKMFKQIAEECGLTLSDATVTHTRAMNKLRKIFRNKF